LRCTGRFIVRRTDPLRERKDGVADVLLALDHRDNITRWLYLLDDVMVTSVGQALVGNGTYV
jgi:hypothetical protein